MTKYNYDKYSYLKNVMGIYRFRNTINGKVYIGQSKNIYQRIGEHLRHAINDKHEHSKFHFYNALRKYPIDLWDIECIEVVENEEDLNERELFYIYKNDSIKNGYNCNTNSRGGVLYGEEHSNSILSDEEVYFIRKCYEQIKNPKEVYDEYFKNKISKSTFDNIWRGNTRKNIKLEVYTKENKEKHKIRANKLNKDRIYNDEQHYIAKDYIIEIRNHYADEILTSNEVYKKYSFINRNTFNDIWYGKTYTELFPKRYVEVRNRGRKYIRKGNNKGGK